MMSIMENLLSGKISVVSDAQLAWEDKKTADYKLEHGDCNSICRWTDGFGWVPESGCPVHD